MKRSGFIKHLPSRQGAALAVVSALIMALVFVYDESWKDSVFGAIRFLSGAGTWFGLMPFLIAVDREKNSGIGAMLTGWLFGTVFFFGSCWWLTFSPITYAGFSPALAYFLLLIVCLMVGLFPALFALIFSILLRRWGLYALFAAPFIWTATEFLRFWATGNNWNAIGYSQAFNSPFLYFAQFGGVLMVGFVVVFVASACLFSYLNDIRTEWLKRTFYVLPFVFIIVPLWLGPMASWNRKEPKHFQEGDSYVAAIQPNVPMSDLTTASLEALRRKHVVLAEKALSEIAEKASSRPGPVTVIFPESPMNFMYEDDREFQEFVAAFATQHNASVLFNSAEPDLPNRKYFNSAVMVDPTGKKIAQYDKIYLVPFGESVPAPLQGIVPALVGSFSYGNEYDLLPFGKAKGGIMICFESHFPGLSREYVNEGADVLIEMTNDGYLGPTPILRQHLANAVFRAVETNRPLIRVTNVGISAYITADGEVLDRTAGYTEDTRVWSISRSAGDKTFYVRFGDWFAWVCSVLTVGLLFLGLFGRNGPAAVSDEKI